MQSVHRSVLRTRALGAAVAVAASAMLPALASAVIVNANADAEARELQPEFTRGNTSNYVSGTGHQELQISTIPNTGGATFGTINDTSSNRNIALLRFTVPASFTSSADLSYAELQLVFRTNGMNGIGSVRLYGLAPTNPLNTTWNEDDVMYRDAGEHQRVNVPIQQGGQSLLTPSVISQSAYPAAPVSGVAGYGADPNHARRAPGIRYEDAPFSAQVEAENQARFIYNQTHSPALPYINQPAYNVLKSTVLAVNNAITVGDGDPNTTGDGFANIYSDVPESNRPLFSGPTDSWVDDLDASTTFLGIANVQFPSNANYAGQYISLGGTSQGVSYTGGPSLVDLTSDAAEAATRAALVAFIGQYLDLGYHEFTFLVGGGIGPVGGYEDFINSANLQIASKEYTASTLPGFDFSPRLILVPEPATLSLLGLAGLALARRRRA